MNIDDEVLEAAKSLADYRKVSIGEAISELARRGMNIKAELRKDPLTGLTVIHDPLGRTFTSEDVYRWQEEEDLEMVRKFQG